MYSAALAALAGGATVVTPTRRLASAIRRAYDRQQHTAGSRSWPAADVLPWSAWQQRQWESAQLHASEPLLALLTAQQERALWERVIGESGHAAALLHRGQLAQTASEAWDIACAYRLAEPLRRFPVGEEGHAFLGWAEAFAHFCSRESVLDTARLSDELQGLLQRGLVVAPRHLVVYGFDGLDPQRAALLAAFQAAGTRVERPQADQALGEATVLVQPAGKDEIRAAAQWARAILEREPDAAIGVVVPDLGRQRARIARIFDEVLVPPALLSPGAPAARPWNLSLGLPLSEWPVVRAAFLVLQLAAASLPTLAASVLLRSAFLGGGESERGPRALLDARIRRGGEPHIRIERLEYFARDERRRDACPLLLERLRLLRIRARESHQAQLLPSAWGTRLQSLLAAIGWPGERTLDSEEYQCVEAWRELLADLSRLDLILGPITFDTAIEAVSRAAEERLFQPETPTVPVQVMGVLESTALEFDHLFVLGLHAEAWPRPARPNPLLPIELQRRVNAPGSGPDWELAFAQRMTEGWRRAAPRTVFCWPSAEGDRTLAPSPLLSGLPVAQPGQVGLAQLPPYRELLHHARRLESLVDVAARPLAAGVAFPGGARLIQDQAACPFRAFAAHRLGATVLEEPHEGLDARERGSVLHNVVACLWGVLRNSARLAALTDDELAGEVAQAVDLGLARWRTRRASAFKERFLALERERLQSLLLEWLVLERQRAPFEVLAVEEARRLEIGGVGLELRLDRADRLEGGGDLLLDYKTGKAHAASWFDARPDEPQLPLYALAMESRPAGLAFARLARGECEFEGLAARDDLAPGIVPFASAKGRTGEWGDQLAAWRQTLTALGEQFRSGVATVDPKRYPVTCELCHLGALCRVEELVRTAEPSRSDEES